MKNVIEMKKNRFGIFTKVAAGTAAMAGSVMALAQDHTAAIEAASTNATSNVTAAVVAVVGIAAVVMGIGIVLSLLRR